MRTSVNASKAPWLVAAAFAALVAAPRTQAAPVTVTGEFSTFTADEAATDSSVTSYGAAGSASEAVESGQATTLAAGTSKIDFKFTASPAFLVNSFEFDAGPAADVTKGEIFKLGSFTFTNGTWFGTIALAFSLTTHSADLTLDNHVFSGTMELIVNPNVAGDPYVSADYFDIAERPDLGSVRVFEKLIQPAGNPGFTGTADFYGAIGSLDPTSFANPSGGAFLSGSVTSDPMLPAVPEPGALSLMVLGLPYLAAAARKARRRASPSRS